MKSLLVILAPKNFQDFEYAIPRQMWGKNGIEIKTASEKKVSYGVFGTEVINDYLLDQIDEKNFDGIIFIGGGGCLDYMENKKLKEITKNFAKEQKIVGAICAAPRLLLHWGILQGKYFTGWNGDNELPKLAKKGNAFYKGSPVFRDQNYITSDGPESAEKFGKEVLNALQS